MLGPTDSNGKAEYPTPRFHIAVFDHERDGQIQIQALHRWCSAQMICQQVALLTRRHPFFSQTPIMANTNTATVPAISCPPEILTQIFLHVDEDPQRAGIFGPVVAQVCSDWRSLSLALPDLWSTIYISCGNKLRPNRLLIANLHFARSGNRPLTLYVYSLRYFAEIIDTIVPFSHRWERINFTGPLQFYQLLDVVSGKIDALQSCTLHLSKKAYSGWPENEWFSGMNGSEPCFAMLRRTPSLQSVEIDCSTYQFSHAFGNVFGLSPLLKEARNVFVAEGVASHQFNPYELSDLSSLHLIHGGATSESCLPRTPQLQRLWLQLFYFTGSLSTHVLLTPVRAHRLEYLTLDIRHPAQALENLRDIFKTLPDLRVFNFSIHHHKLSTVISALTVTDPNTATNEKDIHNYLPRLHTLRLFGTFHLPKTVFDDFLRSRGWTAEKEGNPDFGHSSAPPQAAVMAGSWTEEFKMLRAVQIITLGDRRLKANDLKNIYTISVEDVPAYRENGYFLEIEVQLPHDTVGFQFSAKGPIGGDIYEPKPLSL